MAGRITITWTATSKGDTVVVARGGRTAFRAGKTAVGVKLTPAGRKLLLRAHGSITIVKRASFRDRAGHVLTLPKRVRFTV